MNLQTLIRQVNRDVDDSFSNADITDWLNRGLDDLTPLIKKEAKTSFSINSSNSYTVPSDLHEIVDVIMVKTIDGKSSYTPLKRLSQRDFSCLGYRIWANNLSIQNGIDEGSIDLYYYKRPVRLVNPTDEPEIETEFHDLLILYAIGMSQFMDEEPERQMDAMNRYIQRKMEYEQYKNQYVDIVYEIGVTYGI